MYICTIEQEFITNNFNNVLVMQISKNISPYFSNVHTYILLCTFKIH